jgi:predicted transposase/invertase (TIGR01784 family)
MLQYITLVLTDYEKEVNKATENISNTKGFKFPPVLPLVFYDGADKWTAETNFLNKTELSDVFHKYIPKFEYELIDLNKYSEEELIRFGNTLSFIMLIDKVKNEGEISLIRKLPQDYIEKLKFNMPGHLKKLLADVTTVILKRVNVPEIEIDEVTGKIYERGINEMFAWADNYDVQEVRRKAREEAIVEGRAEGIAKGRAEGKAEGASDIAKELLKRSMPVDEVANITGLTKDEVEAL